MLPRPPGSELQELTIEPFSFDGWYTDEELREPFVDGMELVDDLILFGEWSQVTEGEKEDDRLVDGDHKPAEEASPVKTRDELLLICWLVGLMVACGAGVMLTVRYSKNREYELTNGYAFSWNETQYCIKYHYFGCQARLYIQNGEHKVNRLIRKYCL